MRWLMRACCWRPPGRAARHRAGRRCADRPGRAGWPAPARPQAADPGPRDAGGCRLHRRRRPAGLWRHQPGAGPPGHGPSTLGTFLRAFTFGHVRQLDRLGEQLLTRAWAAGGGPGDGPMTMDLDSTVCEVHGHHHQGAADGDTHTLGDHPLLATRADTGEVLPRPPAQRAGQHHPRHRPVRRRTGRPGAPPGRQRPADHARRLRGSGRPRPSGPAAATGSATRSPSARPRRSGPRSPPSTRPPGPTSSTPTVAWPRSPRPATGATG
jgi:hypothetical protein